MSYPNVGYLPHPEVHTGKLIIEGKEVYISQLSQIDLTANVTIGEWSMIGHNVKILTHDHYHEGREPLQLVQREKGVKYQDKIIGKDVWLHECIVLYQVTNIPDGVVVGAGSVLTKNPVAYGIYGGNPAKLLKMR